MIQPFECATARSLLRERDGTVVCLFAPLFCCFRNIDKREVIYSSVSSDLERYETFAWLLTLDLRTPKGDCTTNTLSSPLNVRIPTCAHPRRSSSNRTLPAPYLQFDESSPDQSMCIHDTRAFCKRSSARSSSADTH